MKTDGDSDYDSSEPRIFERPVFTVVPTLLDGGASLSLEVRAAGTERIEADDLLADWEPPAECRLWAVKDLCEDGPLESFDAIEDLNESLQERAENTLRAVDDLSIPFLTADRAHDLLARLLLNLEMLQLALKKAQDYVDAYEKGKEEQIAELCSSIDEMVATKSKGLGVTFKLPSPSTEAKATAPTSGGGAASAAPTTATTQAVTPGSPALGEPKPAPTPFGAFSGPTAKPAFGSSVPAGAFGRPAAQVSASGAFGGGGSGR